MNLNLVFNNWLAHCVVYWKGKDQGRSKCSFFFFFFEEMWFKVSLRCLNRHVMQPAGHMSLEMREVASGDLNLRSANIDTMQSPEF